jgi:YggT family protein
MNDIVYVVYLALMIYTWVLVARALLSWFPQRPGAALYQVQGVLVAVTEPYLALFRRFLPSGRSGPIGIDWSFLVGIVVLVIAGRLLALL